MSEIQAVHKRYSLKDLKLAATAISEWQQHLDRLKEALPAKEAQEWMQWALVEIFEMGELEALLDSLDTIGGHSPFIPSGLTIQGKDL